MAYTRAQLRDLIRQRMGWPVADTFVTDSELNKYIADSARELHSLLVGLYPAGHFGMLITTFPTVIGSSLYPLPNDFGRLVSARLLVSNTLVPIEPFDMTVDLLILDNRSYDYARVKYVLDKGIDTLTQLQLYPPPAAIYTIYVFYVQRFPAFAADDEASWMGEDEYIVLDCCLKCSAKQEQDGSSFLRQKTEYQTRLEQQTTPLDLGRAPTIQDLKSASSREDAWWFRR